MSDVSVQSRSSDEAAPEIWLSYALLPHESDLHEAASDRRLSRWLVWGSVILTGVAFALPGLILILYAFPLSPWFTPVALLLLAVVVTGFAYSVNLPRPSRALVQFFTPMVAATVSPEGVRDQSGWFHAGFKWSDVIVLIAGEDHVVASTSWLTIVVPRRAVNEEDYQRITQWATSAAPVKAVRRGNQLAVRLVG